MSIFGATNARESVLARPMEAKFEPKDDITAYELAQVLQSLRFGIGVRVTFSPTQWAGLSDDLKRHFNSL